MTAPVFLQDLVVILTAAVAVVVLLRRLHVPSIAGFIVAGMLVGPHALEEAGATFAIAAETAAVSVITDHVLSMLDGSPEEQSEKSRAGVDGDGDQGTE